MIFRNNEVKPINKNISLTLLAQNINTAVTTLTKQSYNSKLIDLLEYLRLLSLLVMASIVAGEMQCIQLYSRIISVRNNWW